jgi:hypothetical protein
MGHDPGSSWNTIISVLGGHVGLEFLSVGSVDTSLHSHFS